jgi:hypothetical protein
MPPGMGTFQLFNELHNPLHLQHLHDLVTFIREAIIYNFKCSTATPTTATPTTATPTTATPTTATHYPLQSTEHNGCRTKCMFLLR